MSKSTNPFPTTGGAARSRAPSATSFPAATVSCPALVCGQTDGAHCQITAIARYRGRARQRPVDDWTSAASEART